MINEWLEVYDEEDSALPLKHVGDGWLEFKASIPEPHFNILNAGLNFVLLSHQDSLLPNQIIEVFIDDNLAVTDKKQVIWSLITDNIIDILISFGITIDQDNVDNSNLIHYLTVMDLVYVLPGMEDTIGLSNILINYDVDGVERLTQVLTKLQGEEYDTEPFNYLFTDISDVFFKALHDALKKENSPDSAPKPIIDRIINNKSLFKDTVAWSHIVNNGQLGSPIDSIMTFFKDDLKRLLDDPATSDLYIRNIVCLFLISDLTIVQVKEQLPNFLDDMIDDINLRMKADTILQQLTFIKG